MSGQQTPEVYRSPDPTAHIYVCPSCRWVYAAPPKSAEAAATAHFICHGHAPYPVPDTASDDAPAVDDRQASAAARSQT